MRVDKSLCLNFDCSLIFVLNEHLISVRIWFSYLILYHFAHAVNLLCPVSDYMQPLTMTRQLLIF